ncbi:MAG: hypothetical protein HZB21_01160 [Deltaproteobacteria bacterium]|nr:hypothetical protein [Deltaproteobacteria bacterium]MBI5809788.1 hypothetical protein [Deltaproteobacteria bacterium]
MAGHDNDTSSSSNAAKAVEPGWWDLPFDATTNFSLIGFLFGGWEGNPMRSVDLTLDE